MEIGFVHFSNLFFQVSNLRGYLCTKTIYTIKNIDPQLIQKQNTIMPVNLVHWLKKFLGMQACLFSSLHDVMHSTGCTVQYWGITLSAFPINTKSDYCKVYTKYFSFTCTAMRKANLTKEYFTEDLTTY